MSRRSVLPRRSGILGKAELPLRGYFLSVGGALLMLLLAADWLLPAPPPSRVTHSHSALPPIRIHSQLKGPEAVVIDTRGPGLRPRLAEQAIAEAPSQPPETEVADAKVRSPAPPADLRLRESRAQLQSADQAGRGGTPHELTAQPHRPARARPGERRRFAQHPRFEASFGGCVSLIRERHPCQYALAPN
jgi:hypothetical protein